MTEMTHFCDRCRWRTAAGHTLFVCRAGPGRERHAAIDLRLAFLAALTEWPERGADRDQHRTPIHRHSLKQSV